jgi:hypothetical protein
MKPNQEEKNGGGGTRNTNVQISSNPVGLEFVDQGSESQRAHMRRDRPELRSRPRRRENARRFAKFCPWTTTKVCPETRRPPIEGLIRGLIQGLIEGLIIQGRIESLTEGLLGRGIFF